jgi:hypothetical protein
MATYTNCSQEISNFIQTMVQVLERQNQNFTEQQMMDLFNEHLTQYQHQLQKEWQEQLLQAGFKNHGYLIDEINKDIQDLDFNRSNLQQEISRSLGDKVSPERYKRMMIPPQLSEKLEAAIRLKKLADHLQDRGGLSSDPNLLKKQLTEDLELKNRVIDPHWEKIREYQYMRNQYLSAKIEMERTKKQLDQAEKNLNNLHNKNNSLYRFFNGTKKPDKAKHIEEKLKLENQINDLKGQLMKAEETVKQVREQAYQVFRENAPLGGSFSSDRHITEKLGQLIAKERDQSIEYQRDYRPPSPVSYAAQVSPVPQHVAHVSPAPVLQVAQVSSTPAPLKEINSKIQPSTVNLQVNSSSEASRQVRQTRNLATFNALPRQTTMKDIYRMANESPAQEKRNLQKFREDIRRQQQGAVGNRADGVEKPQNSLADSMSHDRSGDLRLDR